jgi:acyl-coenzyme A thioesterase PaaI-like protein
MDANGEAATGIVPRDVALAMTGLEFLNALRAGALVAPPFSMTTGIRPVEIEPGRLVFDGVPSERFYNPMGTVHGGWIATLLDSAMACAIQSMLPAGRPTPRSSSRPISCARCSRTRERCAARARCSPSVAGSPAPKEKSMTSSETSSPTARRRA